MTGDETFNPATVPAVVVSYLDAHANRQADRAAAAFARDAVVVDDGRTYTGIEQIRAWLERSSSEWDYTTTPNGQKITDAEHLIVRVHLEGNFLGGHVDLRYQFTLAGELIAALAIAV